MLDYQSSINSPPPHSPLAHPSPPRAGKPEYDYTGEVLHWEGKSAQGDLIFNLALGTTLVWLPLTFAAVGEEAGLGGRAEGQGRAVGEEAGLGGRAEGQSGCVGGYYCYYCCYY